MIYTDRLKSKNPCNCLSVQNPNLTGYKIAIKGEETSLFFPSIGMLQMSYFLICRSFAQ